MEKARSVKAERPVHDPEHGRGGRQRRVQLSGSRTAEGAGVHDLDGPMPAGGPGVLKRVPLARNRITLGISNDETDDGEDVQSDTESHDGHPQPRLWAEDADDQDANAQLWQGDAEKSPSIDEDDPKGGGWDGGDQVSVGDVSGRVKGLLKSGHSDDIEYLLDDGTVSIYLIQPLMGALEKMQVPKKRQ